MIRTWKLLSLAAIAAALCLYLLPAGPTAPSTASAEDCTLDNTGTLIIKIFDVSTDELLDDSGTQVLVKPDPRDFVLDDIVTDTALSDANTSQDKDSDPGIIRIEEACSTEGSQSYSVKLWALPAPLEECTFEADTDSTKLAAGETEELKLAVDCTGVGPTPTVTPTVTVGPAATVITNTSPLAVSCNGTSVVSVTVKDAAGNPVQTGTAVTISTTLGSVSPSSGFVTGSNGSVFAFFTAPATSGGTATITATAGSISGTASVVVNCGAAGCNGHRRAAADGGHKRQHHPAPEHGRCRSRRVR